MCVAKHNISGLLNSQIKPHQKSKWQGSIFAGLTRTELSGFVQCYHRDTSYHKIKCLVDVHTWSSVSRTILLTMMLTAFPIL